MEEFCNFSPANPWININIKTIQFSKGQAKNLITTHHIWVSTKHRYSLFNSWFRAKGRPQIWAKSIFVFEVKKRMEIDTASPQALQTLSKSTCRNSLSSVKKPSRVFRIVSPLRCAKNPSTISTQVRILYPLRTKSYFFLYLRPLCAFSSCLNSNIKLHVKGTLHLLIYFKTIEKRRYPSIYRLLGSKEFLRVYTFWLKWRTTETVKRTKRIMTSSKKKKNIRIYYMFKSIMYRMNNQIFQNRIHPLLHFHCQEPPKFVKYPDENKGKQIHQYHPPKI